MNAKLIGGLIVKITQKNNVTVVQIPKTQIKKIDFAHCKEPRETLASFYNRQAEKPAILINGGFFNMSNGQSVFNYMDEKNQLSNNNMYRWGMGIMSNGQLIYGCIDTIPNVKDFISGYPVLLDNGRKCSYDYAKELNYNARRSVLGYDDEHVYIVAVEGAGMTFPVLQDYLLGIGVKTAINLDGGGSTKLLHNGKCITNTLVNRAVDNVVAVYLNNATTKPTQTSEDKVLYRAQAGAFKSEANANKLRDQIRALDDSVGAGYAKAYVRIIAGYYKVQIGAYSKKANADRVVADLKSKGINAFVTTD